MPHKARMHYYVKCGVYIRHLVNKLYVIPNKLIISIAWNYEAIRFAAVASQTLCSFSTRLLITRLCYLAPTLQLRLGVRLESMNNNYKVSPLQAKVDALNLVSVALAGLTVVLAILSHTL